MFISFHLYVSILLLPLSRSIYLSLYKVLNSFDAKQTETERSKILFSKFLVFPYQVFSSKTKALFHFNLTWLYIIAHFWSFSMMCAAATAAAAPLEPAANVLSSKSFKLSCDTMQCNTQNCRVYNMGIHESCVESFMDHIYTRCGWLTSIANIHTYVEDSENIILWDIDRDIETKTTNKHTGTQKKLQQNYLSQTYKIWCGTYYDV